MCYSNLNVKVAPTHAGISVGPDGGSHQMLEDISLMRGLPNMRVLVPADYAACCAAIRLAAETPGPVYIRMGRAAVPAVYAPDVELEVGRAYVLREGTDVTIIACGVEIAEAMKAADALAEKGISAEVIDAFCVKPLDAETILASLKKTGCAVVAEEHSIYGGLGSAVSELAAEQFPWNWLAFVTGLVSLASSTNCLPTLGLTLMPLFKLWKRLVLESMPDILICSLRITPYEWSIL